jgi:hypothetical protein
MFDMMLGPLGTSYWVGPSAMPQARFHHDWSKVAFLNGAVAQPLDGFAYAIGTQGPASIFAATGAAPANLFDTSISKPDSLSKDCLATHFGIELQNTTQVTAADTVLLIADTRIMQRNFMFQVFYGERTNEECSGTLLDFPAGMGPVYYDATAAFNAFNNGMPSIDNIRPLPQPLACKGGDTYFRVTVTPSVRLPGTTLATIRAFMLHVYGVSPARRPPIEAHSQALQALALPR